MFFLLGQKTTKLALHLFQHIALAVVEPLAHGFSLWRERGKRFFRFGHSAPQIPFNESVLNPSVGQLISTKGWKCWGRRGRRGQLAALRSAVGWPIGPLPLPHAPSRMTSEAHLRPPEPPPLLGG